MHEQLGGGAGDEGGDTAADHEGVRAIFGPLEVLLQDPGVGFGDAEFG